MIFILMLLTMFTEQQIETHYHRVLVIMGMIYGGMYLHRVLIRRYTCWWDIVTKEKRKEN